MLAGPTPRALTAQLPRLTAPIETDILPACLLLLNASDDPDAYLAGLGTSCEDAGAEEGGELCNTPVSQFGLPASLGTIGAMCPETCGTCVAHGDTAAGSGH